MQNRWQSPLVWSAIIAQFTIIIALFNPDVSAIFKVIGTSLLEIVTVLGILNNPTSSTKF